MLLYRDQGTALQSVSAFSARKCFTPSLNPLVPGSRSTMTETARATFFWQRSLQNGYAVPVGFDAGSG
jgi:hypothetical protein